MSDEKRDAEPRNGSLSECEAATLQYLALVRQGHEVDVDEFCSARPHIEDELRAKIAAWGDVEPLLDVLQDSRELTETIVRRLSEIVEDGPADTGSAIGIDPRGADDTEADHLVERLARRTDLKERYRLEDKIGKGGQGTIRVVRDLDLQRDLAMKIMVRPDSGEAVSIAEASPYVVRQFLDEARVTARLDHPGIPPVHTLGIDDLGRPYFTMKRLPGETLDDIIGELGRDGGEWTLNRAVGVLHRVTQALAFAHSNGIIHRDVKPKNIMVGRFGEVYLIDWGLNRSLRRSTTPHDDGTDGGTPAEDTWALDPQSGVQGTPSFMSPEQAHGEVWRVDERSDVYSAGAVLYNVLTGQMPYVAPGTSPLALVVINRVRRGSPDPVAELAPDAPETLVQICEKAMAREIEDRFEGAAEMAHALEQFLADVSADREEARRQERRAKSMLSFLMETFRPADPSVARGRDVTVLEALDQAVRKIDDRLPEQHPDRPAIHQVAGNLLQEHGRHEEARVQLVRAADLFREVEGGDHRDTLVARADLGRVHLGQGSLHEAEAVLRETLERLTRSLGEEAPESLRAAYLLAQVLTKSQQDQTETEQLLRRVLDGRLQLYGPNETKTLEVMNALARVLEFRGDLSQAIVLQREVVAGFETGEGDDSPYTIRARKVLAGLLLQAGELHAADTLYRLNVRLAREVFGPRHPTTLEQLQDFAQLHVALERYPEAESMFLEVLEGLHSLDHPDEVQVMAATGNLAGVLLATGREAAAEPLFRQALASARSLFPAEHRTCGRFRLRLGLCLMGLERFEEAREHIQASLVVLEAALGAGHPWTIEAREARDGLSALAERKRRRKPPEEGGREAPGASSG